MSTATDYYSAENLQKVADAGEGQQFGRGRVREARILLAHPKIDTVARRKRVSSIAMTMQNLGLAGRYSEAVETAARDLTRQIENGEEHAEHYVEQVARRDRERQQAEREVRLAAAVMGAQRA